MRAPSPLRQVSRDAVREQITQAAIGLFVEAGFDETTVDDIANAVGMSQRTFFRYFASKDDVVLIPYERAHQEILALVADAPQEATVWEILTLVCEHSLRTLLLDTREPERMRQLQRVVGGSTLLFASYLRHFDRLQEKLTDAILDHESQKTEAELHDRVSARAIVGASFANLHAIVSAIHSPRDEADADTRLATLMKETRPQMLRPPPEKWDSYKSDG